MCTGSCGEVCPLVLLNAPLLVDVLGQTAGLRDSTGPWRVATGLLGALAAAWWTYPRLQRALAGEERARTLLADARRMLEEAAGSTRP